MQTTRLAAFGWAISLIALVSWPQAIIADPAPSAANSRIGAALQNISTLTRKGRVGYANFWEGNKYVQCRRMPSREVRCEAAGTLLQPSLKHELTPERTSRLDALGWRLDPSFGNYTQTFPADMQPSRVADEIVKALAEGYDARVVDRSRPSGLPT